MKQYIRKRTDQTYCKMLDLIQESRINFTENDINLHLIRRFWRVCLAYKANESYENVLKIYFSGKSIAKNIQHTKISNSLLK